MYELALDQVILGTVLGALLGDYNGTSMFSVVCALKNLFRLAFLIFDENITS